MKEKNKKDRINKRVAQEKERLINALTQTGGIIASACKAANISRVTYYRWYDEDTNFREQADNIKELQKDFAESLILKKMKEGDTTMLIFYAKTQMKDRGYTERQELTGKNGEALIRTNEINISKLSQEERDLLLRIGQDIINNKE